MKIRNNKFYLFHDSINKCIQNNISNDDLILILDKYINHK
jgi:hypothetical protein